MRCSLSDTDPGIALVERFPLDSAGLLLQGQATISRVKRILLRGKGFCLLELQNSCLQDENLSST